eukprot:2146921-Rhodomonas_salina.3
MASSQWYITMPASNCITGITVSYCDQHHERVAIILIRVVSRTYCIRWIIITALTPAFSFRSARVRPAVSQSPFVQSESETRSHHPMQVFESVSEADLAERDETRALCARTGCLCVSVSVGLNSSECKPVCASASAILARCDALRQKEGGWGSIRADFFISFFFSSWSTFMNSTTSVVSRLKSPIPITMYAIHRNAAYR